jgi:phospholipid/cholesterol/gamma-HCH transport system substrate-binding protein
VNISTDRAADARPQQGKAVEREARYAVVGLFAIATIVLAFGFVWWYSDASDRREYARYEIHFFGSVSGLAQGSPVRYLGVDVGRVERLQVDPNNPRRVKIVVEIDSSAPISGATEARLGLLGLTGLLFIDLREDPKRVASTPLVQGDRYPVIRARKGDIEAFLERLPDAITRAAKVMERVEKLLNQENIDAVGKSLANIREATGELPALSRNASTLADELKRTATEVSALSRQLSDVVDESRPDFAAALGSLRAASERLSGTAASVERIVSGNEGALSQLAGSGGADLQQLLLEVRDTSAEVRALARQLRENPSALLRERPETGVELPE